MKLVWDQDSEKLYETGVSNGVLYPQSTTGTYPKGVAWNGLTSVSESPSGAEASPIYADNEEYLNLLSKEKFAATIGAYTYPEEFAECDGSKEIAPGVYAGQQNRKKFGFVYKTIIGNDTEGTDHGYKIHLVYNGLASPTEKGYSTVNDSTEAIEFSWSLSTTPVEIPGAKPSATLTIDSTKVESDTLAKIESILFGSEEADARLPLPAEIIELMKKTVG